MKACSRLRIGIVCGPLHPRYGGPASVVAAHARSLAEYAEVTVFGVADPGDRAALEASTPGVRLFDRAWPERWFRGAGLAAALDAAAPHLDILHAHMLWDQPVFAAWRAARAHRVPLIVTPHGSAAEAWRVRAPHKRLYRRFIADQVLRDAAAVQVLSTAEADALERLQVGARAVVIPNGLPARAFDAALPPAGAADSAREFAGRRIVLFMGRLWSEKGLDILPDAWAQVVRAHPDAVLVLAGPDYRGYAAELRAKIARLELTEDIVLTGAVSGARKAALFAAAELFVLPSRSEGFSMALLEAAASGTPSIFSPECNFSAMAIAGGGWEVPRTPAALAASLDAALALGAEGLARAGDAGRRWARERYTLEAVTGELLALYARALERPPTIAE